MCRSLADFLDVTTLRFVVPKSPITGTFDLQILVVRYKANLNAYRYNYLVSTLCIIALTSFIYWRLILSASTTVIIFVAVDLHQLLQPGPLIVGAHGTYTTM